jgi:hypothetical protein
MKYFDKVSASIMTNLADLNCKSIETSARRQRAVLWNTYCGGLPTTKLAELGAWVASSCVFNGTVPYYLRR